MSEQMSEEQGFARIRIGENEYEAKPSNTTVYTHLGCLALYDHVYIHVEEQKALYLWAHNPSYPTMLEKAMETDCQKVLNMRHVSQSDEETYMRHATADLGDTIPEGWEDEQ